jgi:putative redox protein
MVEGATKKRSMTRWLGGALFEHQMEGGVAYRSDAPLHGKSVADLEGPTPMEMLIGSLAGCTGVDIVSMLEKMRVVVTDFRIEVSTTRAQVHPKIYEHIHLDYHVDTESPDMRKVLRAAKLSTEKYCSVSAMLAGRVKLTYALHHAGETIEGVMHEEGLTLA